MWKLWPGSLSEMHPDNTCCCVWARFDNHLARVSSLIHRLYVNNNPTKGNGQIAADTSVDTCFRLNRNMAYSEKTECLRWALCALSVAITSYRKNPLIWFSWAPHKQIKTERWCLSPHWQHTLRLTSCRGLMLSNIVQFPLKAVAFPINTMIGLLRCHLA